LIRLFLVLAAAMLAATPLSRPAIERVYARGIYPVIQPALTSAGNFARIAFFDVALVAVLILVVGLPIAYLRSRPRGWLLAIGRLLADFAVIAAVLYLWFLLAWGMNYRREPLRSKLDFDQRRVTEDALRELAQRDVSALNRLHAGAHRAGWPTYDAMPSLVGAAFTRVQRDLGMSWTAVPGRPKRSIVDFYFRRAAVDGMTDPFFLETLANYGLLPVERPFVVAHEWSHLAGYADESEANFVAWLICMRAPANAQYSGWLSLYGTIIGALPPGARAEIAATLEAGPRADLEAVAARVRLQSSPLVSRAGYAAYDKFLKANRVQAGIRSYGEVIQLLLGTRFDTLDNPILRNR
jgi:hypothetical protein